MSTRLRIGFALVVLGLVSSAPTPVHAAERVMVIVDERVGDARAGTSLAEVRLSERLLAAGQQVVEAVETDTARRTLSIDKLLGGAIGAEVTALNCDVLIVGRTVTVAEEIPYGVSDMSAVTSEWTVRAIGVDTGRVLASSSGRTAGAGTQLQAASGEARKKAADAMFAALAALFERGGAAPAGSVSLSVKGLQALADVRTLEGALKKLRGVRQVAVRFVAGDETRIDVDVEGVDTWGLAALLEGVGLEVAQLSRGAISATWLPWGAGKALAVAAFSNRTGIDRHDWIEAMLAEVFATELANSRYLRVDGAAKGAVVDEERPEEVARAIREAGAELLAAGVLERAGDQLRLSVTVFGKDGKQVTAAQLFGGEADLVGRTRELVWAVDARLFERLFAKAALAPYRGAFAGRADKPGPVAGGGDTRGQGARLEVVEVALEDIFPARLSSYATRPIGRAVVRNPGTTTVRNVRLRVDLPAVSRSPAVLRVDDLGPGAEREVPIAIVLERERVQALSENTPAQAELALSWDAGGGAEGADMFTVPVVIFDKNALDWSEPKSVAAFVTHKDPNLDAFARAAERQARGAAEEVAEALRLPLSLYEALGAHGVRYQTDARNPFGATRLDSVAFPSETLSRKAGDCDDLSVLMAALFESQGVAAGFILTPGHILVAWDTGVAARDVDRLGLPPGAWLERDGRAWVPLEVTRVGAPFGEAIVAGAAEVARHRDVAGALQVVPIGDAWAAFPPFPGVFPALAAPSLAALSDRVRESAAAVRALGVDRELAQLSDPAASDDPDALNRVAVRLVQRGEWRRAASFFERAGALTRGRADLAYNLANLRVIEGQRDTARATYEQLRDDARLRPQSLYALGVLAYLEGGRKEARALLEQSGLPEAERTSQRLGLVTPPRPPARPSPKKPSAPPPDPFAGIRAGVDRVPLDELLLWLR